MYIIDAHAHIIPRDFPALPRGANSRGWPSMVPLDDGRARMLIDGREYRVFDRGYFDLDARLEYMDREGFAVQVVSPLPELLGHWLDASTAIQLAELCNTSIADAVRAAPGRLAGLGMLPLQDIDRSVEMIGSLVQLGLKGVHVGSNVNGRSIADPAFDPVLAELASRGLAVFVHGLKPAGADRLLGPGLMVNVIGIPGDTASAIASFISTDVLKRHPDLKLGFAHGGGTFGAVLDRMEFVWQEYPVFRKGGETSPREYVKRFYFDTITYSVPYLRFLIDAYGVDAMMCGTDGPGPSHMPQAAFIGEACRGDTACTDKILSRNAARFLGLSI
jgi:aminocarboxymuconate-semialdehyde decarboxylase